MDVICKFSDQGPTFQERLLQLLLAKEREGDLRWPKK